MKTFSIFVSLVCLIFQLNVNILGQVMEDSANAIFHKGNWELNFSASIGDLTTTETHLTSGSNWNYTEDDSYSMFYLQLGVIPAYFLTDGLSFEPEINILIQSKTLIVSKPSLSFIANLAYNFNLPEKNFVPFVRLGYGISNSLQIPTLIGGLTRVSEKLDVNVLNAGIGIKIIMAQRLLFRSEINYRRYSYGSESGSAYYNSSYDYTLTSISGIFGFSVLL